VNGSVFLPTVCRAGSVKKSVQPPLLLCQSKTFSAYKPIPKLEYECCEGDDESLASTERSEQLQLYMRRLETTFSDPGWWAAPVDELNICAVTEQARAMTEEERSDFGYGLNIKLYGDERIRLVVVVDPCVRYSYATRNAFILQRADGRVFATQVLNAFFTRFDGPLDLDSAVHNGETVLLVKTITMDGTFPPSPYATYSAFTIDPRSHRVVPKDLFKVGGQLTNMFRFDTYLFDDEKLEKQWHEPEIIRNGKLSPRFSVFTLSKGLFNHTTYVWNGAYYALRSKGKK
jgi:hypothetical protein